MLSNCCKLSIVSRHFGMICFRFRLILYFFLKQSTQYHNFDFSISSSFSFLLDVCTFCFFATVFLCDDVFNEIDRYCARILSHCATIYSVECAHNRMIHLFAHQYTHMRIHIYTVNVNSVTLLMVVCACCVVYAYVGRSK